MIFEDLTEEDLRVIGVMIPTALTFSSMKKVISDIELSYCLGEIDAATAFFIAQECSKHYKDIDKVVKRRTEDLLKERGRADLATIVK